MLKIIELIFILLSGISLIIIASLFNGIAIDNFYYKNIHIQKLYLKYDKNLNISAQKIIFKNKNSKEIATIKTAFNIDYEDGIFIVDVEKFFLEDTDLEVTGIVHIDPDKIDFDTSSKLIGKNLILAFDKKMKKVVAKTVFADFEKNSITLTFEKPYYDDVLLDNSKVSYFIKENTLKLYLKTNSLFNDTIKGALARYNIDIDTIQYDGTNKVSTNIFIPFDNRNIFVEVDAHILNSNLENFGYKYKVNESIINYKNYVVNGITNLNHIEHNDMKINNSILNYKIDVKNNFKVNITSDDINATKGKYNFQAKNASLTYQNNKIIFSSDLYKDQNTTVVKLNNITDLKTKKTSGTFNLNYNNTDHNISLDSKDIIYKGNYEENLKLDFQTKVVNITKPYKNTIQDIYVNVNDNNVTSKIRLNNGDNTYAINLLNTTNLDSEISQGKIEIEKFVYKNLVDIKNKSVPYSIYFHDNIILNSTPLGLTYFQSKDTNLHQMVISNPNKILENLNFLTVHKNSDAFIEIDSNDFNDTSIIMENVNLDINSTYFKTNDNNTSKDIVLPKFPKTKLLYTNSTIKYNDFTLPLDTLNLSTNDNTLDLNMQKEDVNITLKTEGNRVFFNANKLNDKYINSFFGKELLEGGYVDLNVYGDDINELSGDINFYDTTVKNVTLINSLLTFVNTTPAIINPLLALPTLFRLAETGFDTNGYYMNHGDGSFIYNFPKNELDIYDLYTDGKMSNFIVNSHTNLDTKKIIANVDISFLKDFTTTLNHVPLLGYIIMGDDGEFHTSVDITGTTDNPELETHTVKEASQGFTGIIKRILTLPLQPFKIKVTEEQIKEHNKRVEEHLDLSI